MEGFHTFFFPAFSVCIKNVSQYIMHTDLHTVKLIQDFHLQLFNKASCKTIKEKADWIKTVNEKYQWVKLIKVALTYNS